MFCGVTPGSGAPLCEPPYREPYVRWCRSCGGRPPRLPNGRRPMSPSEAHGSLSSGAAALPVGRRPTSPSEAHGSFSSGASRSPCRPQAEISAAGCSPSTRSVEISERSDGPFSRRRSRRSLSAAGRNLSRRLLPVSRRLPPVGARRRGRPGSRWTSGSRPPADWSRWRRRR